MGQTPALNGANGSTQPILSLHFKRWVYTSLTTLAVYQWKISSQRPSGVYRQSWGREYGAGHTLESAVCILVKYEKLCNSRKPGKATVYCSEQFGQGRTGQTLVSQAGGKVGTRGLWDAFRQSWRFLFSSERGTNTCLTHQGWGASSCVWSYVAIPLSCSLLVLAPVAVWSWRVVIKQRCCWGSFFCGLPPVCSVGRPWIL